MVPNVRIGSSTLSEGRTGKLACIPRTLEEVSLEVEVTSHEKNTRSMQLEIDRLRRRLHRERRKGTPSSSGPSSDDDSDNSYCPRSRTPSNESFSCDQDHHYRRRRESLPRQGLGNDTMGKALNQISKSPFTRRNESGKLPRQFTQPTFTMYNGRTDPVKHISHFNQRMAIHSRNEALMCKVFLSSLGLVAIRWFDGLREGSISSFNEPTRAFRA